MGLTVGDSTTYYSAQQQDKWVVEQVFKGLRRGYFVDAGASGRSNTLTLEAEFEWNGLAVEPHPDLFQDLKARRRCIVENVCLTDAAGEVEFVMNRAIPGTSGIRSTLGGGILETFYKTNPVTETVRIKGYPLWELLRKHAAPRRIDYLSLDIEGAEWLALKDFPFEEYSFGCMTIERGADEYYRLRSRLLAVGYRLVRVAAVDDYFVHPELEYRVSRHDALRTAAERLIQPLRAGVRRWRVMRRQSAARSLKQPGC